MERERVVTDVSRVRIRAPVEQEPHGVRVAHRQVEPGRSVAVTFPSQTGIAAQMFD